MPRSRIARPGTLLDNIDSFDLLTQSHSRLGIIDLDAMPGFSAALDGGVNAVAPLQGYGTAQSIFVASGTQGMLLRFDTIFGSGANQIPIGSTITAASVRVTIGSGNTSGSTTLNAMRVRWADSATWTSMSTSGPGIQFDNVEAAATPDASIGTTSGGAS